MNQPLSESLIKAALRGDTQAFRRLVEQFQGCVFSLALKMTGSVPEAEDVVQDTFLTVWLRLNRYSSDQGSFLTWLYTVASRKCIDHLRQRKAQPEQPLEPVLLKRLFTATDEQHQLENREWATLVEQLTGKLPPKQRLVFTLSVLEGLDADTVAHIAGMSSAQVKSNLYVARQTIRQKLLALSRR